MNVFPCRSLIRWHTQQAEKKATELGVEPALPVADQIVHLVGADLDMETDKTLEIDDPNDYIYSVQLIDESGQFTGSLVEARCKQLSRDRLTFSKTILKKYLRECVVRESTVASPWIVRHVLANRYNIPIAPTQETIEKNIVIKEGKLLKRKKIIEPEDGTPVPGGPKKRRTKAEKEADAANIKEEEEAKPKEKKKPIKFPIEDLEVDPVTPRELKAKITGEEPRRMDRPQPSKEIGVAKAIFEPLMVTYHFLQAFGKPLMLSPFTLDDYQAALQFASADYCPLMSEIHATLINIVVRDGSGAPAAVSAASTSKAVAANGSAPRKGLRSQAVEEEEPEEEEEEESGDELDSRAGTPEEDEASEAGDEAGEEDSAEPTSEIVSAATTFGKGWNKRTLKADDRRAGWENALLGLLAKRATPEFMPRMMGILSHLTGKEHPDGFLDGRFVGDIYATAKERYPVLPISDKLAIIHFLCDQAVMTKPIKSFFEECEITLTELRKERVELSRQRKKVIEQRLAEEKKKADEIKKENGEEEAEGSEAPEPQAKNGKASSSKGAEDEDDDDLSPPPEVEEEPEESERDELESSPEADEETADANSTLDDISDTESAADTSGRRSMPSRQQAIREKTLQRKATEAARQAEFNKQKEAQRAKTAETRRLQAERQRWETEEERIAAREEAIDLEFRRHILAPRMRPLGKDRFHDRYWWFDGVGNQNLAKDQAFASPGSQTMLYGTGRLFVQGATEEDWNNAKSTMLTTAEAATTASGGIFGNGKKELKALDKRREEEYGQTILEPNEWAVYERPEEIDQLIAWLRNKGNREYAFKRQLTTFVNYLKPGMQKRLQDIGTTAAEDGSKSGSEGSNGSSANGSGGHETSRRRAAKEVGHTGVNKHLAWTNAMRG